MRPNIGDIIVDKLHQRRRILRAKLADKYKSTKPFRMEPISTGQLLNEYDKMTPQDLQNLRMQYGDELVNEMEREIETLRRL